MCKIIGIDISKQTFDVGFMKESTWHHLVFENNGEGLLRRSRNNPTWQPVVN
jgi:transposase